MADYTLIFWCALALNAVVTYRSIYGKPSSPVTADESDKKSQSNLHKSLLLKYLSVYLLAAMSDWLQGPYVYALYSAYGYAQRDIAVLFVAGFGSSMIFGSFVGGMADAGGRKKFVLVFAITYIASCVTKHFHSFNILLLGRFLGGIATSLLFSIFDSWLIKSHSNLGLESSYLSQSFAAASYGNYVVAILAGLVANRMADTSEMVEWGTGQTVNEASGILFYGGYLNPFDCAILVLLVCSIIAVASWEENYGEGSDNGKNSGGSCNALQNAAKTVIQNEEVLLCGIVSSLYEGSMYVFVFMWTPCLSALTEGGSDSLPFGLIFATFMVCCMAGSSTFTILLERNDIKIEELAVKVLLIASCAFFVAAMSGNDTIAFLSMNFFEISVGMYFPSMGTQKSQIVPENQRSAIYNIYRIPLNFIVLASLLTNLTYRQSFFACGTMLFIASILQAKLAKKRLSTSASSIETQPLMETTKDETV